MTEQLAIQGPAAFTPLMTECPQALQAVCCRLGTVHGEAHCWYVR